MDSILYFVCLIVAFWTEKMNVAAVFNPYQDRYIGCFENSRSTLDTSMGTDTVMDRLTLDTCRSHCEQQMSTFFAVRFVDVCHCGDRFSKHQHLSDSRCFLHCAGNDEQLCGGSEALRIHWVCPIGYHGPRCEEHCSNCGIHAELGSGCYFNGTCTCGCQDGWDGPKCDKNLGPMLVVRPPSKNTFTSYGSSFVCTCMVANTEPNVSYSIKWYTPNGVEVKFYGNHGAFIRSDGLSSVKLHLLQDYELANERYTCRTNISGLMQQKDVNVNVQPFITEELMTMSVTEGKELTLFCQAQGLPKPQYRFYKNSTTNPPLESGDRIKVDGRAGLLTLKPARMEDEGHYICKAFNNVGYDTKGGRISVSTKPKPSECWTNNGDCSHYCTNNDFGSYKCTCSYGYRLKDDGRTCQAELSGGGGIGSVLFGVASAVVLTVMIPVCNRLRRKNRQMDLESTAAEPAANAASPPGHADDASGFANRDDRSSSLDSEIRVDIMPAINPDFAEAQRPTGVTVLIPNAPDVEPPSYEELFGGS